MTRKAVAKGIILVGHGSRDPLWRAPIEAVAARLAALQPATPTRCAYLELQAPDVPTAAADLARLGVRAVTLVPMFLGTGKHARADLPRLLDQLRAAHPAVAFRLRPPVGEDPRVLDLLAALALE
ncbi:CbiX/SirB N-terminal domain-containing protein [Ramlibacter sp.]|uniref:sirohydrochlorin chelatase n=1 Tax=Ramlibacter sp. TaxID=1917967 RepID=UPI002BFFD818|nr:CbiX/SirB N-terminal domain-containing protein [Ramlibacter sp.]HWI82708.1 CbiX/SirB N-terminal domain-containing protein [Ramlibacter sp.]